MIEHLQGHRIDVGMLMLLDAEAAPFDVATMSSRLAYFEVVERPARTRLRRGIGRLARQVRRVAGRRVEPGLIGVDEWCPAWFRARTAAVVRDWRPDVVIVEYVFLSACLERLRDPRPRAFIDALDVMHLRREAYAAAGLVPRWFRASREEERRGLLRADAVLAISEADATALRNLVPERLVLTVPHGEPVREARLEEASPGRLLFVASYNDLNVAGLRWFLDAPWGALRTAVPGIELVVCGTIASKLGAVPSGVSVRGFVPALAEEYVRARVVIHPVRGGTGLQLKLVEALCHGRPVVSTRAGAGPLAAEDGQALLIADDPDGFAIAVRRLVEDDGLWRRVSGTASARAARLFSPDVAFAPLIAQLKGAA